MAADRAQNLQDTFLNHVRKAKIPLTIFLVNGVKLQGVVTWFDNFCVLLRRDGHSQLVYKHAISTIMPGHPVQLFEGGEEGLQPGEAGADFVDGRFGVVLLQGKFGGGVGAVEQDETAIALVGLRVLLARRVVAHQVHERQRVVGVGNGAGEVVQR